jgi:hypothetical protein
MEAWSYNRTSTESTTAPISGEISIGAAPTEGRAGGKTRGGAKPRTADRVSIELNAGLRQRGAAAVSVHVRDLSTHGFRIDTHLELEIGIDVWLRLPGLEPALAHVMWVEGYHAGCAFERPLHPAVLEMIVKRAGGG